MLKKRAALREVAPLTPINEGTPAVRLNDVLSSHNPLRRSIFRPFRACPPRQRVYPSGCARRAESVRRRRIYGGRNAGHRRKQPRAPAEASRRAQARSVRWCYRESIYRVVWRRAITTAKFLSHWADGWPGRPHSARSSSGTRRARFPLALRSQVTFTPKPLFSRAARQ